MESPDKCDKCIGYSICANHIKKGDHSCNPFLKQVEEKILQSASPNNKQSALTSQIATEIQGLHDAYWTTSHDKTKALLDWLARQLRTLS